MIVDAGKTPAVIRMKDGGILSFFNNGIYLPTSQITYADETGKIRYTMNINSTDRNAHNRALHYVRSYPSGLVNGIEQQRLVLFTDPHTNRRSQASSTSTVQQNLSATPLFEVISPQIYTDGDNYQMTFWTNITDASKVQDNNYVYTPSDILKVSEQNMQVAESALSAKALCTCPIHFELLRQITNNVEDRCHLTPVIKQIGVIMVIKNGNFIFDFAGGGGNTGFKKHMHTNALTDAGFAVAVFAPSAIITPLSWS